MSNKILEIIIGFDRRTKTIVQIFVDTIIVIISILLATKVLSEHLIPLNEAHFFVTVGIVVPATVMVGLWLGLYKIMVSHMSILTLKKMLASMLHFH